MFEAKIAGKHTREELHMVGPREVSHNIDPARGGCTVHWGGEGASIGSHEDCKRLWRQWQDLHMGPKNRWADIAYTAGFCQHGYVFPGRGLHVRTAAQGTTHGNDISYAFCHLNERGAAPTVEARQALAWLVQDARVNGDAGHDVWAHRDWHSTECPGDMLAQVAHALSDVMTIEALMEEEDMPTAEEIAAAVWNFPAPGGETGSDGKPLTMAYVLMRDYQAGSRVEKALKK